MILELSLQALEDEAIDPNWLKESLTGVRSGTSNDVYRMLVLDSALPAEAAASLDSLNGTNLYGTIGRTSFVLAISGPAKTVGAG